MTEFTLTARPLPWHTYVMGKLGKCVAVVAALASLVLTAPQAHAQEQTVRLAYSSGDSAGVYVRNGGAAAGIDEYHSLAVPSWARIAQITIRDYGHRPVGGVAHSSLDDYTLDRAIICSRHASTLDVRRATSIDVQLVRGAVGPDARHGCARPMASLPRNGVVIVTFR